MPATTAPVPLLLGKREVEGRPRNYTKPMNRPLATTPTHSTNDTNPDNFALQGNKPVWSHFDTARYTVR